MNPLRIMIDATCIDARGETGSSRYLKALVSVLTRFGKENRYVLFGFEKNPFGMLPPFMRYVKIPLHSILGPTAREIGRRRFVTQFLKKENVDCVHFILDMAPVSVRGTPVVFTLFDLARKSPHFLSEAKANLRTRLRTKIRYGLAKKADLILTTSEASRDSFIDKLNLPAEKIRVVPIAPDAAFSPGPPDIRILKHIGLEGVPFALFVGELGRQKNEKGLLHAFRDAVEAEVLPKDARLVFVGDKSKLDEEAAALCAEKEMTKRVAFLGRVSDDVLAQLYRGARCLCLPSYFEGFGLPLLEAMSCGTPCIASDSTSLPEIAGDAAIFVDPDDRKALALALTRLFVENDLRDALSSRALERAKKFSQEEMAALHLAAYGSVAHGG